MRCVILFDGNNEVVDNIKVGSRDYVRDTIIETTEIDMEDSNVVYCGPLGRNRGDVVERAVFIDTEAGTSEEFQISARITAEVVIT